MEEVFADDRRFFAGAANQAILAMVGPASTASLDGAPHLARRRIAGPFLSRERADACASELFARTRHALEPHRGGPPFRLHALLRSLFVGWLADVVVGETFPREIRAAIVSRLLRLGDLAGAPLSMLAISPGLAPVVAAAARLVRPLDVRAPLLDALARARARDAVDPASLLGAWVSRGLDDAAIADEVVTYLGAGYDTTASAASFAFDRVLRDPSLLARVRAALAREPEAREAPLLEAVVAETLRLSPILPVVSRVAAVDTLLAGRRLRPGDRVGVAIHLLHRDPTSHASPSAFLPGRFPLERDASKAYAPFGGGARRCPGRFFALRGIETVLAAALGGFELVLAGGPAVAVARGSTVAPSGGVRVRVVR